jgi:hypothetical protein
MWRAGRINDPVIIIMALNQRPDANDRMIDVLGELLAQRRADFVIIFAIKIIGGGESA